ncbi:uncharacterized protein LOC126680641 [Mercurialis annua]|uniref:uncharacterized protein LOC126680641 n=1 Tax=Mercurialis annua TaxID=3986 RepID=UPI00215EA43E|nr:uncharacterized protein LOC126680641 [Mercurialis annua]
MLKLRCNSGTRIRTLQDPWIPGKGNYLLSARGNVTADEIPQLVCDLMNEDTCKWNSALVSRLFDEEDYAAILNIPIPYSHVADRLVWDFTKDGQYTVKSGYYKELLIKDAGVDSHSYFPSLRKSEWKVLWQLKIPSKIRIFIWKLLHKGIPIAEGLNFRIKSNLNCPHCHEKEDIHHMLFNCDFARRTWFLSDLHLISGQIPNQTFDVIWSNFLSNLHSAAEREWFLSVFAFNAWSIWKARNSAVFKDSSWTIEDTTSYARQSKKDYDEANAAQLSKVTATEKKFRKCKTRHLSRSPLLSDAITIQYDGGISKETQSGSVAGIAFNNSGQSLGSFARSFRGMWDPGIVEFLALREASSWAKFNGWNNVIFEGDAIQVSKSVNSGACQITDAWGLCQDIWLLSNSFNHTEFRWIKRGLNKEAHKLVQLEKAQFRRYSSINGVS